MLSARYSLKVAGIELEQLAEMQVGAAERVLSKLMFTADTSTPQRFGKAKLEARQPPPLGASQRS